MRIVSEKFANYYLICLKHGLSTKDTVNFLMHIKDPIISSFGNGLNEKLEKGAKYEDALNALPIDSLLKQFLKVSFLSQYTESVMETYLDIVHVKINQLIQSYSKGFQICTYVLLGIVVIIIYQVLMVPMQMIQNIQI